MPSPKSRDAAVAKLQRALVLMDTKGITAAGAFSQVRGMVEDALSYIQEQDPLKRRVAFVILALQESTEVMTVALRGKEHERVIIRDRPLYELAMKRLHKLTEPEREAA